MQKIHVSVVFDQPIEAVFAAISDHRKFLSGGGMTCRLIAKGEPDKNGVGAIRTIRTAKYTFIEKITAFEQNKSYDYLITEISPKLNMTHHNGWLEFTETSEGVRVDWHSHFTFNTPIIGRLIGALVRKQAAKVFRNRLLHARETINH